MKSEFELIEHIKKKASTLGARQTGRGVGIGDDCAVLPKDRKTDLVITTDLLIEDIDFRLEWTRAEYLGHKALAISLSDIAAMGANPVWAMLSLGVPETIWKTDFVERFYAGWFRLAKKFNVSLVGGDISKTPDKIVADSIVAGEVKRGKAILRSGAKAGDLIFVTGKLGGAAAGLKLLETNVRLETASGGQSKLLKKQLVPLPRIYAGQALGEKNLATSMIDLSDGLSSDLAHICQASKAGARIFSEKIPLSESLRSIAAAFEEKLNYALNGGEDYELLFTANPKKISALYKKFENFHFAHIGEITFDVGKIELVTNSETTILKPEGFRHF